MSGYGLSAFLFSTLSHIFFAGSASPLLLLLSLGSSLPMIVGFFFVRPVPPSEEELKPKVYSETRSSAYEQRSSESSHTPLLNHDPHISGQDDDDDGIRIEPNTSSSRSQNCETSRRSLSCDPAMALDMLPNIHGKNLWCSSDFWLLFVNFSIRAFNCFYLKSLCISNILLVVSGTGLMCMSSHKNTP